MCEGAVTALVFAIAALLQGAAAVLMQMAHNMRAHQWRAGAEARMANLEGKVNGNGNHTYPGPGEGLK